MGQGQQNRKGRALSLKYFPLYPVPHSHDLLPVRHVFLRGQLLNDFLPLVPDYMSCFHSLWEFVEDTGVMG